VSHLDDAGVPSVGYWSPRSAPAAARPNAEQVDRSCRDRGATIRQDQRNWPRPSRRAVNAKPASDKQRSRGCVLACLEGVRTGNPRQVQAGTWPDSGPGARTGAYEAKTHRPRCVEPWPISAQPAQSVDRRGSGRAAPAAALSPGAVSRQNYPGRSGGRPGPGPTTTPPPPPPPPPHPPPLIDRPIGDWHAEIRRWSYDRQLGLRVGACAHGTGLVDGGQDLTLTQHKTAWRLSLRCRRRGMGGDRLHPTAGRSRM